jgi:hypothetical protein
MSKPFAIVTGAGIGLELAAIANITPAGILAEQHRKMAEPGGANH